MTLIGADFAKGDRRSKSWRTQQGAVEAGKMKLVEPPKKHEEEDFMSAA